MGLTTAMNTALTGLSAAETTIDVVGNNLANAQTIGFKSSDAVFATQFFSTQSLGSHPNSGQGGTNPRQTGLGVQTAAVTPDFTQGAVELTSKPSDLAIEGEGFFIVEGLQNEQFYTRNGVFTLNADSALVNSSGQRLMGYGVDDEFNLQTSELSPLSIPIGAAAVAQSTRNVFLEGAFPPTGDVADTAEVVQSGILGDAMSPAPDTQDVEASTVNGGVLNGSYTYMLTYFLDGSGESRPTPLPAGSVNVVDGQVRLDNLPQPPTPGADDNFPAYDEVRIYRNLANAPDAYYLVGAANPGDSFVDNLSDQVISDVPAEGEPDNGRKALDRDGPRINLNTRLTDVLRRDGVTFERLFSEGELSLGARKGDRGLAEKSFTIEADTTVGDLVNFISEATGIRGTLADPNNPLSTSENLIEEDGQPLMPGVSVQDGRIRIVSNNGVDNAVTLDSGAFTLTPSGGTGETSKIEFTSTQQAKGESAVADFVVYDSLGIPLDVRVTAVLDSRSGDATTYRWFADSPDNDPNNSVETMVGTGLVTFDGQGKFLSATNASVAIERRNVPSTTPLQFDLDFSQVTGLDSEESALAATRQDGSQAGTLTRYFISEDGMIEGVFDNGQTRTLGQLRLARFTNPAGLEQRGQNLFAVGPNSGLPIEGQPGNDGIGSVLSGAVELSNTDVGGSLIDLVLATTQYRGNTRVVTAAQQMLEELLNIRR